MKRICKWCGKVVPYDHECEKKPKRKDTRKKNINSGTNGNRWKKVRDEVRARDLCCVLCFLNCKFSNFDECHHIIERNTDDSDENVFNPDRCVMLCSSCHHKVHENPNEWKKYVKLFDDYIKEKNSGKI